MAQMPDTSNIEINKAVLDEKDQKKVQDHNPQNAHLYPLRDVCAPWVSVICSENENTIERMWW